MFDKVINTIKLVVMIIVVGFLFFQYNHILEMLRPPPVPAPQIIQITDNAWRVEFEASKRRVKDLEKKLKASDSVILAEVKKRNEKIDEIARITAELKQTRKLNQKSDHVYLKGKKTDHHFIKIYKTASDGKELPWAWAMFHPNQVEGKLWKVGTYPIKFETDIIETENDKGKYNRYVELNMVNDQMKETKGNRYPIKISSVEWAKNPITTKQFYWWNPRIGFQGLFTNELFAPGFNVSLSSYGRTKRDMDWRFLTFGLGAYSEDDSTEAVFNFTPVEWNVGNIIPIIENLFFGPTAAWDTDGEVSYGVGFSIPL